jgi:hypothetical protein
LLESFYKIVHHIVAVPTTILIPTDPAEILNEQFQSVFTKENLNNCPNKGNSPYQTMSDIKINCKGVTKLLGNRFIVGG